MVECASRNLVAIMRKRERPVQWGRKAARLAQHYNNALLAIETGASPHGLAACTAAIDCGYQNIYRNQRATTATFDMTEVMGWRTDQNTKANIINAVIEALFERYVIPSVELLEELRSQRWEAGPNNDKWKMVSKGHDDLVIAYGITLCVIKQTWTAPREQRKPEPVVANESARYWQRWEKECKRSTRQQAIQRKRRMYAGI